MVCKATKCSASVVVLESWSGETRVPALMTVGLAVFEAMTGDDHVRDNASFSARLRWHVYKVADARVSSKRELFAKY